MGHQCDCEAGKKEYEESKIMKVLIICILFTTQYNQHKHNDGQEHIIEHTDLNTET